jgi:hypothetical protein
LRRDERAEAADQRGDETDAHPHWLIGTRPLQTFVWTVSHIRDRDVSHALRISRYRRSMTKTATPWGAATLVERLTLKQQAGEKRFSSVVELLENDRGERLVRFAYSTDGTTRRGPVTLRERDVERLREALAKTPELASALGGTVEAA